MRLTARERHLDQRRSHPSIGASAWFQPKVLNRLRCIVRDFKPDVVQANGARTLKYGRWPSSEYLRSRVISHLCIAALATRLSGYKDGSSGRSTPS